MNTNAPSKSPLPRSPTDFFAAATLKRDRPLAVVLAAVLLATAIFVFAGRTEVRNATDWANADIFRSSVRFIFVTLYNRCSFVPRDAFECLS